MPQIQTQPTEGIQVRVSPSHRVSPKISPSTLKFLSRAISSQLTPEVADRSGI